MANMEQIKRGVARYFDEEFTNKITGWQKWVFGAAVAMYIENLGTTIERLTSNDVVKALGVIDGTGSVDVEKLYKHLMKQAQKGPVTFTIPMIGAVTLSAADVEKLYTFVLQA